MKTALILILMSLVGLGLFFWVTLDDPCYGYRGKPVTLRMDSVHVGDQYKIVVYLPKDYQQNKDKKYPVLYQLDGNYYGKLTTILAARYKCTGEMTTDTIVVGIGYDFGEWINKAVRDHTYPVPEHGGGYWSKMGAGGGLRFYNFLRKQLIPHIDKHFRTIAQPKGRTLSGHDLGAYFALMVLFRDYGNIEDKEKLFANFIAISPTIIYNKNFLFDLETQMTMGKIGTLPVTLFTAASDSEESVRNPYFPQLEKRLGTVKYPGFRYKCRTFNKLTKQQTAIPGLKEGIRYIYNDPPATAANH